MKARHEICSYGWRWIDYQYIPEDIEREHLLTAIDIHTRICGERRWAGIPAAWDRTRDGWSPRKASSTTRTITTTIIF